MAGLVPAYISAPYTYDPRAGEGRSEALAKDVEEARDPVPRSSGGA